MNTDYTDYLGNPDILEIYRSIYRQRGNFQFDLNKSLKLLNEKVTEQLHTAASSYTKPEEIIRYYRSNAQAMASIESIVMEEQVVNWVVNQAKQTPKLILWFW